MGHTTKSVSLTGLLDRLRQIITTQEIYPQPPSPYDLGSHIEILIYSIHPKLQYNLLKICSLIILL